MCNGVHIHLRCRGVNPGSPSVASEAAGAARGVPAEGAELEQRGTSASMVASPMLAVRTCPAGRIAAAVVDFVRVLMPGTVAVRRFGGSRRRHRTVGVGRGSRRSGRVPAFRAVAQVGGAGGGPPAPGGFLGPLGRPAGRRTVTAPVGTVTVGFGVRCQDLVGAYITGACAGSWSRRGEGSPRSRHGCQIRILARRALNHANLRVSVVDGSTVAAAWDVARVSGPGSRHTRPWPMLDPWGGRWSRAGSSRGLARRVDRGWCRPCALCLQAQARVFRARAVARPAGPSHGDLRPRAMRITIFSTADRTRRGERGQMHAVAGLGLSDGGHEWSRLVTPECGDGPCRPGWESLLSNRESHLRV